MNKLKLDLRNLRVRHRRPLNVVAIAIISFILVACYKAGHFGG